MDKELKDLLDTLSSRLGERGEALFAALVKTSRVQGATEIALGVAGVVAALVVGASALHYLDTIAVHENPYGEIVYDGFAAMCGRGIVVVVTAICAWQSADKARGGVVSLSSPEGAAFAWILNSLSRAK